MNGRQNVPRPRSEFDSGLFFLANSRHHQAQQNHLDGAETHPLHCQHVGNEIDGVFGQRNRDRGQKRHQNSILDTLRNPGLVFGPASVNVSEHRGKKELADSHRPEAVHDICVGTMAQGNPTVNRHQKNLVPQVTRSHQNHISRNGRCDEFLHGCHLLLRFNAKPVGKSDREAFPGPKFVPGRRSLAPLHKWGEQFFTSGGPRRQAQGLRVRTGKCWRKPMLRIRHLDRNARGAERNVFFFPRFVEGTFGVRVGGFAAAEFNREGGAEITWLQPVPFDPDILDAGHFCSHVFDSGYRGFFVHLRHARSPLNFDHMQNRLRLTEFGLPRPIPACEESGCQKSGTENLCSSCEWNSHVSSVGRENNAGEKSRVYARLARGGNFREVRYVSYSEGWRRRFGPGVLVVDPLVASSVAFATKSRLCALLTEGSRQEAQCSVPSVERM